MVKIGVNVKVRDQIQIPVWSRDPSSDLNPYPSHSRSPGPNLSPGRTHTRTRIQTQTPTQMHGAFSVRAEPLVRK